MIFYNDLKAKPVFKKLWHIKNSQAIGYIELWVDSIFFSFFEIFYLFHTHTHPHTQRMHTHTCTWAHTQVGGEEEGDGERNSQAKSPLSAEPDSGLALKTPRSFLCFYCYYKTVNNVIILKMLSFILWYHYSLIFLPGTPEMLVFMKSEYMSSKYMHNFSPVQWHCP